MLRPEDLDRQLAGGDVGSVYLLMGPAEYLIDRFVGRVAEKAGACRVRLEASEVTPDEVRAAYLVPDLFSTARLVHVRGAEAWKAPARKAFLESVAGKLAPGLRVALSLDAKRPSQAKLPPEVRTAFYWNPFPSALPRLAEDFLKDHGARLARGVGDELVRRYGADLRRIDQEAYKLAVTAGPRGTVDRALVRRHCPVTSEDRGFVVAETITSRERAKALRELDELLGHEGPHALLAMLANRMRRMRLLRELSDRDPRLASRVRDCARQLVDADKPGGRRMNAGQRRGLQETVGSITEAAREAEVGELSGIHPRQLPVLVEHSGRYRLEELEDGLKACARADRLLKGEAADQNSVMVELVVKLTADARSRTW